MAAPKRTRWKPKPVILTAANGPASWMCPVKGCGYVTHNDPGPTVEHRVSYACPIHGMSYMLRTPHIGGSLEPLEGVEPSDA